MVYRSLVLLCNFEDLEADFALRGLDFDDIAATLKDSYTGDNPSMLDIVARNSRPLN